MQPTQTKLAEQFSYPDAMPSDWPTTLARMTEAKLWHVHTTRADGRPHVTPLVLVRVDEAFYFCTGPDEQKGHNLQRNNAVTLTTSDDDYVHGVSHVVDGHAVRVTDEDRLRELAAAWVEKYGDEWRFEVADHAFAHGPGAAWVFEVRPDKIYAYDRDLGGATRFSFR